MEGVILQTIVTGNRRKDRALGLSFDLPSSREIHSSAKGDSRPIAVRLAARNAYLAQSIQRHASSPNIGHPQALIEQNDVRVFTLPTLQGLLAIYGGEYVVAFAP